MQVNTILIHVVKLQYVYFYLIIKSVPLVVRKYPQIEFDMPIAISELLHVLFSFLFLFLRFTDIFRFSCLYVLHIFYYLFRPPKNIRNHFLCRTLKRKYFLICYLHRGYVNFDNFAKNFGEIWLK